MSSHAKFTSVFAVLFNWYLVHSMYSRLAQVVSFCVLLCVCVCFFFQYIHCIITYKITFVICLFNPGRGGGGGRGRGISEEKKSKNSSVGFLYLVSLNKSSKPGWNQATFIERQMYFLDYFCLIDIEV